MSDKKNKLSIICFSGDFDKAVAVLKKATRLNPDYA